MKNNFTNTFSEISTQIESKHEGGSRAQPDFEDSGVRDSRIWISGSEFWFRRLEYGVCGRGCGTAQSVSS